MFLVLDRPRYARLWAFVRVLEREQYWRSNKSEASKRECRRASAEIAATGRTVTNRLELVCIPGFKLYVQRRYSSLK